MPKSLFQCVSPFVCADADGVRTRVSFGDVLPGGDWRIKGRESLFAPLDGGEVPVQTAESVPGIKSAAKRSEKRTSDGGES